MLLTVGILCQFRAGARLNHNSPMTDLLGWMVRFYLQVSP